jgi:oligoribonuclease NrnB/cAMP/cGMP phosphodiesterase (DHH superfamily)
MPAHLITHKDCLDGATAALIGEASGLVPVFVDPDRAAEQVTSLVAADPDAQVYLADVSLAPEALNRWRRHIAGVLDHHATSLTLAGEPRVTIDLGRDGSHLLYDYAVERNWLRPSTSWDRLIATVEAYDLWRPEHSAGQNLDRLFRMRGLDWYRARFANGWVPYSYDEANDLARLLVKEAAFLARNLQRVHYQSAGSRSIAGLLFDEEGSVNELSHQLLNMGQAVVLVVKPDGRLSARSDHRVDAAQLMADLFQGGGHRRAAGGRVPPDCALSERLVDDLLSRIRERLETLPG